MTPPRGINVLSDGRSTAPQSASKSAIASVQSTSKRETTSGASTSRAAVSSASSRASRVGSLIGSHVLDVDVLDLRDLVDEQIDEPGLGKGDDQLVDRAARSPFEDLDAHDVAAHGTDAARDLPERTGAIGQPDPHRVVLHHSCTLRTLRERSVSRAAEGAAQCAARVREAPIVERSEQEPAEAKRTTATQSFGNALRRFRTAWLMRCSFSMSANRTNASPPSPNPMPGDVATSASCTRNDANSSEPIS